MQEVNNSFAAVLLVCAAKKQEGVGDICKGKGTETPEALHRGSC